MPKSVQLNLGHSAYAIVIRVMLSLINLSCMCIQIRLSQLTDKSEFQGLTRRDPILQPWPGERRRRLAPSPKRRVCSDATHSVSSLLEPASRQRRATKKRLPPQQRRQNPPHLRVRESPVCGTRETSNLTPQPGSVPTTTLTPTATRRAVSVCR